MDRRQFLRRSLAAAGSAAVASKLALPTPAFAGTGDRMGNVYGAAPCPYRLRDLVQDCRYTGGLALGNPVFAPQGSACTGTPARSTSPPSTTRSRG